MRNADDLANTPGWFRALLAAALLGGAGSGYMGLTQTDDRYRGSDAKADFAERDATIVRIEQRVYRIETQLAQHLQHSAKYTEKIEADQRQMSELQAELKRHIDRSSH